MNRNDRHDTDPIESMLIRAGHFLWQLYKQNPEPGLEAGLESVWTAKRAYRAELKARREESARKLRDYWAARKAA